MQNIRTQWYDNSSLTDANLTCKLATLLVLITVSRMSMIEHLNTEFVAKEKDKYIFYFNKHHKCWRKGQAPPVFTYFAFGKDKALCAVEILDEYINHSKP